MTEPTTPTPQPVREVPVLDEDEADDYEPLADLGEFFDTDFSTN